VPHVAEAIRLGTSLMCVRETATASVMAAVNSMAYSCVTGTRRRRTERGR